jgi:HSP20 family molecular chaperone IbpA
VDTDSVQAAYKDGILEIRLTRTGGEEKTKKIPIA